MFHKKEQEAEDAYHLQKNSLMQQELGNLQTMELKQKIEENEETRKKLGVARDAVRGVRGSFSINSGGFSKNFEHLQIQKLKIFQNPFKIR